MLDTLASIAQIVSVISAFIVGLWSIWRKIDIHQANSAARSAVVESRLDRIESQFGPNGGGLREAVNRISADIKDIDAKVSDVCVEVAEIKGEFRQHIRENKETNG